MWPAIQRHAEEEERVCDVTSDSRVYCLMEYLLYLLESYSLIPSTQLSLLLLSMFRCCVCTITSQPKV